MKIVWTNFAVENLKNIFDYYYKKANSKVAHKIRKTILHSAKILISNPKLGQTELYLEKFNKNHRYIFGK